MTEALTRTQPGLADIERMADYCVKSKLFNVQNKEQAVALMLLCEAKGLHPMEAVERYHIIQGRHSMRADAMLAEFQRRGGKITWIASTAEVARAEFMAAGLGKPFVYEYTFDMAKRAGLTGKDNWRKDPEAMLRARCITGGVRACDPGVNQGAYTPDEVESFDSRPEVDVTPPKPIATAGRLSLATVTQAAPVVDAEVVAEATHTTALGIADVREHDEPFPGEGDAPAYASAVDVLKAIKALKSVGIEGEDLYSLLGGDPETFEVDVDKVSPADLEAARAAWKKRAKK